MRGSPKATSVRELIEKKGFNKEEKSSTLPRKGTIYAKKESGANVSGRKVSTLPRNRDNFSRESTGDSFAERNSENFGWETSECSLDGVSDITADTSLDYIEFSSQTLPRY